MAPTNRFDISGRNYIVTGGAQGIGYQVLETLAESGANVVGLDIKSQPSVDYATLASRFGVKAQYFQADVANEESLTAAFHKAVDFLGSVDGSITCAGIALEKAFEETTWNETRRLQEINVVGTYHTAQLTAEQLKKQGRSGSIVLIASITSHTVLPFHRMSAYGASKGAVKTLSEALAIELAPHKIRVNSISPGFIDTEMTQEVRTANPKMNDIMQNYPPLQRIGTRDDLTGAIIYLLSDAASYTTGADIAITGGLHVGRIGT
ncbi:hypothetical protein CERZMDRAFT_40865 [Cercospora zeae-maydis SCOH1-5]|uniref:Uncharacterized protein n=1 Tax=Cercospora zeae-maydis SCOH1-5 TaxID=717836 RepID=A0A6A6FHG3_9PEZI|nr:hypothetical protein CERZMDRAFT_40865 [Cercospora zeae-maydis SCOH1-5]